MVRTVALTVLLALSACGYQFQGSGSILPPDVKTVYIPAVENDTTEAALTQLVTEALRDRFDRFGAVRVVESMNGADAVLNAKILGLRRATNTSSSETDTTLQQDTVLAVGADLKRTSGPLLWRNPKILVTFSYGTTRDSVLTSSAAFAGSNLGANDLASLESHEITRGQEQQAFTQMAEEVAKRIYNDAVAPDF